jgi:ubiquitin carboxyl-terminal hydrolase 7
MFPWNTWQVVSWTHACLSARRLLLFPQGNQGQGSVSLFLENVESAEAAAENDKWAVCAQFAVAMVNPNDDRVYKISSMYIHIAFVKDETEAYCTLRIIAASHRFNPTCTDWGFAQFVKTASLGTPVDALPKPLMEGGALKIVTVVKVVEDETGYLWHSFEKYYLTIDYRNMSKG